MQGDNFISVSIKTSEKAWKIKCLHSEELNENRVISMSLYGSNPKYTKGAKRNPQLVSKVFPGWKLRIYLPMSDNIGTSEKRLKVPQAIIDQLQSLNVQLVFVNTTNTLIKNPRLWRFLVANDVTVDRFLIRDIDSRLIPRDAIEVAVWIQSGKPFHCIRDNPGHCGWPVNAGLWGAVPKQLYRYLDRETFSPETLSNYSGKYKFLDQMFLRDLVWPKIKHHAYCSDSISCNKWESSYPFSTNRSENLEFVGKVILGKGKRRSNDVARLQQGSFNTNIITLLLIILLLLLLYYYIPGRE